MRLNGTWEKTEMKTLFVDKVKTLIENTCSRSAVISGASDKADIRLALSLMKSIICDESGFNGKLLVMAPNYRMVLDFQHAICHPCSCVGNMHQLSGIRETALIRLTNNLPDRITVEEFYSRMDAARIRIWNIEDWR